jgi:hypothetical protein
MSSSSFVAEPPWRAGLRGARANLLPGLVLQAAAVALVVAYYQHAATRSVIDRLSEFRTQGGLLFGVISTGFFGGLVPMLYLKSRRATRRRYTWNQGAGIIAFWAYKGLEIELFYRLLARTVGAKADVATVLTKMSIDQFVYCPLFAVPVTALVFAWIEAHYRATPIVADVCAGGWYRRQVLPVLLSNLGVWLPTVAVIYALPTPLQLPLQNLVLCFFTLLLARMSEPIPASAAVKSRPGESLPQRA